MNVTLSKIAHPDFIILSDQKISKAFLKIKVNNFFEACLHVGAWPYFRNKDKSNLLAMFNEQCGTCSTKHALLKELANENNFNDLQLMLGIFKMNERNTPKTEGILKNYHLDHIPEAHCYLRYKNQILDFTNINAKPIHFLDDLLFETEKLDLKSIPRIVFFFTIFMVPTWCRPLELSLSKCHSPGRKFQKSINFKILTTAKI